MISQTLQNKLGTSSVRLITLNDLHTIAPGVKQHALIVGKNGSGKSVFGLQLLEESKWYRCLVIDPKREIHCKGATIITNGKQFRGDSSGVIVLQTLDRESYNIALKRAFEAGNWRIYIDDLLLMGRNGFNYPPGLEDIYVAGRSKRVTIIALCQRPTRLPLCAITECDYRYMFNLEYGDDKKRMREMLGDNAMENLVSANDPLSRYNFWYKNIMMDEAEKMRFVI